MKFLSSSSSSSASTTASIDGHMCNPKSASAGCLAGVLRRLFCFNSLPTYPYDQIKDAEVKSVDYGKLPFFETEEMVGAAATPGIVARLMGLESMPVIDFSNTQINPNSISRSRSMNSVDSCREFGSKQGHHRRVKTSLSFRGAPTFVELEDENFFILSFNNGVETEELGSKVKKASKVFGELKPRKAHRCGNKNNRGGENVPDKKNKENQEFNKLISDEKPVERINQKISNNGKVKDSSNILRPRKNSNENSYLSVEAMKRSKPTNHEGKSDVGRTRRRKKKKKKENESEAKKVETECNSENSSPVSVLDFVDIIDPKVHTSEEDSRLTSSNSRRTLSVELENSSRYKTDSSTSDDQDMKINEGKCHGSRKKDYPNQNYVQMWSEICKMAEGDVMEFNWIYRDMWKLEDFEDIVADFGLEILQQLLDELFDQLVGSSH